MAAIWAMIGAIFSGAISAGSGRMILSLSILLSHLAVLFNVHEFPIQFLPHRRAHNYRDVIPPRPLVTQYPGLDSTARRRSWRQSCGGSPPPRRPFDRSDASS